MDQIFQPKPFDVRLEGGRFITICPPGEAHYARLLRSRRGFDDLISDAPIYEITVWPKTAHQHRFTTGNPQNQFLEDTRRLDTEGNIIRMIEAPSEESLIRRKWLAERKWKISRFEEEVNHASFFLFYPKLIGPKKTKFYRDYQQEVRDEIERRRSSDHYFKKRGRKGGQQTQAKRTKVLADEQRRDTPVQELRERVRKAFLPRPAKRAASRLPKPKPSGARIRATVPKTPGRNGTLSQAAKKLIGL